MSGLQISMELPSWNESTTRKQLGVPPVACRVTGRPHVLELYWWSACSMGISGKGPLLATRLKLVFRALPLWKTFLATYLVLLSSRTSLSIFCLPNKGWLSQWKKHLLNPLEQSIPMIPYTLTARETRAKFVKISSAEHSVLETINSFWFLQMKSI